MDKELDIEIFRAGDYGAKGVWGEAELERIAADYDPALHEAPVTVDHARRGPALGWVAAVRRVGDRLVARLRGLNARFLELLREGAFKKRSAEIYPRLAESGGPYLRAVSFLGAGVPEVKGLADPELGEAGLMEDANGGAAARAAAGESLFNETEGEFVAFEPPAENDAADPAGEGDAAFGESGLLESGLPDNTALGEGRREAHISFTEVSERLRGAGVWRPAWSEHGIEAFFAALPTKGEIPAGVGRALTPAEWFAEFLESLPAAVALDESAPVVFGENRGGARGLELDAEFLRSGQVDPESVRRHRAAVAFMEANPGAGYAEALSRCAAGL